MTKTTKAFALLLAVLMVVSVFAFAGCSGEDDPKTKETVAKKTTDDPKTSVDPDTVYTAEVKDLHEHEFKFLVRDVPYAHLDINEVYADGITGDKVNDAVFQRNSALERDYNCYINEERNEDPTGYVVESLQAGEYTFDYIYHNLARLRSLTNKNLLADLNTLESIDLNKVWWDQNARTGASVEGKLFFAIGDAGTMDDRSAWIMYFNKQMVADVGGYKEDLSDFYKIVLEGKWTIDLMYDLMVRAVDDKDGNGVLDPSSDVIGYLGEAANNIYHVVGCGGGRMSQFDAQGHITISDTLDDNTIQAWAKLKPLLTSEFRYVSDSGNIFRSGHAAFWACNVGSILNYAASGSVDFGVIPMPKLNEQQVEYWNTVSNGWVAGYAIPSTAAKAEDAVPNGFVDGCEQAAYFLDAYGYRSVDTLTYAFYDQVVSKQLLIDKESRDTLALALKNKLYDPVLLYAFGQISEIYMQAGSPFGNGSFATDITYETLSSKYESCLGTAREELRKWCEQINPTGEIA